MGTRNTHTFEIKSHNFEEAKNKLKLFSENLPAKKELTSFEVDGGLFNLGNHKVTGSEMNKFTSEIQDIFFFLNDTVKAIYKEFSEVYMAFEYLDKDYIQSILLAIKSAEEASYQARDAHQDIKRTVEGLGQTIEFLKVFKDSTSREIEAIKQDLSVLTGNEYFEDIDGLLERIQENNSSLAALHEQLSGFVQEAKASKLLITTDIEDLQEYKSKLSEYKHLHDIDLIWENMQENSSSLTELCKQLLEFKEITKSAKQQITDDVEVLKEYKSKLSSYKYLENIDSIWINVEDHKSKLGEHKAELTNIKNEINNSEEALSYKLESIEKLRLNDKMQFTRKLNISYAIGGTALLVSIAQLIFGFLS